MVRFAEDLSTDEIKYRITGLLDHKIVGEMDGYLQELRYRKKRFQFRIFDEMVILSSQEVKKDD